MGALSLFLSKQILIRIRQLGEIRRSWPRVQLFQQSVVELLGLELRDFRGRIVDVAEDERLRRAHLLAGGEDLAVPEGPIFLLGVHARAVHPLNAVVALLHDALLADRDVRVREEREDGKVLVLVVVEEIEAAHIVRAVVRAVLRPDTAVVGHLVDAFLAVRRGGDRADDLAGCLLAVHAHHGLVVYERVLGGALVITVDPDPVHLAAAPHFLLADRRDVVLGLAGDGAGVAAGAGRKVHREAPRVPVVLEPGIQADRGNYFEPAGELGVLAVLLEGSRADEVAPFHVEVVLRRGELESPAGLLHRGRREPEARGRTDAVGVHAGAVADAAGARAPVAEVQRHDVVGLAGENPGGRREGRARRGDGDEVLVLPAEPVRRREAHVRRVVPRELRERLRNLLQPAVVREAAVEDAGIGSKDDLEAGRVRRRRRGRRRDVRGGLESPGLERAVSD